jgi:hypothetical protein
MMTKYFFNWTDADLSQMYNSENWDFKAGSHMLLKEPLADFFAGKLTDRELQKAGLQVDDANRAEYMAKCFQSPEGAEDMGDLSEISSEKTEALIMNAEAKRKAPKKKTVKSDDDSFEGLK